MLTRTVKWTAIAALIGGVFLHSVTGFALLLQFVVVAASVVVLTQAATMHRYVWMALFIVLACLFNFVFPVPLSDYIFATASIFAAFLFFFSLELVPKPQLSIASITDLVPGSESL